jgi:uncharacterized protein (TIGR00255 family)
MIKSMTGFASATREAEQATTSVTVKTVNHRFLDVQFRLPQSLAAVESSLRASIQRFVARGRVEVTVHVQLRRPSAPSVEVNEGFAAALAGALGRAREAGWVEGTLSPGDLLRFPQAITVSEQPVESSENDAAALQAQVEEALTAALEALDTMRTREGQFLRDDLDKRREGLSQSIDEVATAAANGSEALQARLAQRVQELGATLSITSPATPSPDPAAVAQEIVRFAARSDISEEIVRFRAHLVHWTELSDAAEPCGRKLDFLLQEMNREINTIGSKSEGVKTSELIVHVKAELERMREQVQNVE